MKGQWIAPHHQGLYVSSLKMAVRIRCSDWEKDEQLKRNVQCCVLANYSRPGARFSKVPIINGPGKLFPFTLKIEVSIVLHLT